MDGENMNKILDIIQELLINENHMTFNDLLVPQEISVYKRNSIIRLAKTVISFRKNNVSENDLLCSLKNCLLPLQLSLYADNHITNLINEKGKEYGLYLEADSRIYALVQCDMDLNKKYITDVFTENNGDHVILENKKLLCTSPYIYNLTGFEDFRSLEQKIIISSALKVPEGCTALLCLSTGGGKSLVTQTIAYQISGKLTVVIVPTVSLALDQVRVASLNIKHETETEIFCYFSGQDNEYFNKMLSAIKEEKARLVILSPEAIIKNKKINKYLYDANEKKYLANIIIDEAHILIEWGAFFRTDYQCLEAWRKKLLSQNSSIRTYLLSATFERKTVNNLKLLFSNNDNWIEVRCDSLRKEPRYIYIEAKSYMDKIKKMKRYVKQLPHPMIIYVASPNIAEECKRILNEEGYWNVETFTGKTNSLKRKELIKDWAEDEYDVMIATSAFGVGVDKPDVRTVLHMYAPENANKYYQELGRGGRDGSPCLSVLCIEPNIDYDIAFNMTNKVMSEEKIFARWFSMLYLSERYNNRALIDTSIKPPYIDNGNGNDIIIDDNNDINRTNMKWNLYVILLLRRYDLIDIEDMIYEYDIQKYYIQTVVKEPKLFCEDSSTQQLVRKIREEEWTKYIEDFSLIKDAINSFDIQCFSEVFRDTYELVSEYCAGCKKHTNIRFTDPNRFPLLNKIQSPILGCSAKIEKLFNGSSECLVTGAISDFEVINKLISMGIRNVVIDDYYFKRKTELLTKMKDDTKLMIMGVNEFSNICSRENWYLLDGGVLLLLSSESKDDHYRMVFTGKCLSREKKMRIIFFSEEDEYINLLGKNLYDLIDGPRYGSYIVQRMED